MEKTCANEIANGRSTLEISPAFIVSVLGEKYDKFPKGTKFKSYEGIIPIALIPLPDGGLMCLAFDTPIPRGFPIGSFVRSDTLYYEEFLQQRKMRIFYDDRGAIE